MDDREFVERDSLLGADGLQRVVNVRQVVQGDVAHACVNDFVFAHAAMQPTEEKRELDCDRQKRCEKASQSGLREYEIVEWHGCQVLLLDRKQHQRRQIDPADMGRSSAAPVHELWLDRRRIYTGGDSVKKSRQDAGASDEE